MSQEMVTIERYVVRKKMHLGPLRREIREDSVIEWQPETGVFKIDGNRIEENGDIKPSEAMRQLKALNMATPENPAIEPLEGASDQVAAAAEMKTSTLCVLPILGCLVASEHHMEEKGIPPELSPSTEEQLKFMEMFEDLMHDLPDELESLASDKTEVINSWLKDKGFDIQLAENSDPNGFSVASILDILMEWLNEGKRTSITGNGGEYTGVLLKEGVTVSHLLAVHNHPVVRIATKSGDTVCMSMVDDIPEGRLGMFLKIADLEKVKAISHAYKGVSFPMVDLDDKPDISWINGFGLGSGFFIGEAIQQSKFRMNEKGARAQSAVAMNVFRSALPIEKPHIIDQQFLLWIERDGIQFPLFAALICEDAWKEPAEL